MERFQVKLDELKKWKDQLVTEHKMWKNELETQQKELIRDFQQQCLLNPESNNECRCT